MKNIGVVEGFFGPAWPSEDRKSYAEFLSSVGAEFYIYAPKEDSHLRKAWREEWDEDFIKKVRELKSHFAAHGIRFGLGFSPFGLGTNISEADASHLKAKLELITDLEIDMLGLFFDDMPTNENLARTQVEALRLIQQSFTKKIIFCPSYYTYDPILEKVFGRMPQGYLEDLASALPLDVSIAWTGPKVISPELTGAHLIEVTTLLKRKPFIWENLFANDGPRNCKFLKLKPFSGRDQQAQRESEAFSFNMMNQPQLSKIVFLASMYTLEGAGDPEEAFQRALDVLTSQAFTEFFRRNRGLLASNLDLIPETDKLRLRGEVGILKDLAAKEISDWLTGVYTVGSECLTD
ncbi:MAG TPA: beta-N-acetylglucosaminidase domain-containing protein [Bacteriovoracaceae bacterium]|nr:beta-N-acetylglucosaminidase domain-containing protein [Bacteriovoracaceae bacterium]